MDTNVYLDVLLKYVSNYTPEDSVIFQQDGTPLHVMENTEMAERQHSGFLAQGYVATLIPRSKSS